MAEEFKHFHVKNFIESKQSLEDHISDEHIANPYSMASSPKLNLNLYLNDLETY